MIANNLSRFTYSLILLVLILLISIILGCDNSNQLNHEQIISIHDETKLPSGLSKTPLIFQQNTNSSSNVLITDLSHTTEKIITFDQKVNNINISPFNRYLVFAVSDLYGIQSKTGIYLYDIGNESIELIKEGSRGNRKITLQTPNFTMDEYYIIFQEIWHDTQESRLTVISQDGDPIDTIVLEKNIGAYPVVSPDLTKIIFQCGGKNIDTGQIGVQICLFDRKTNQTKLLTNYGDYHGSYLFTPDSRKIIYTESEGRNIFQIFKTPYQRIYSMDIDGKNRTMIMDFSGGIRAISENGKYLILEGTPNKSNPHSVYVSKVDGSELIHLAYFDELMVDWYIEKDQ